MDTALGKRLTPDHLTRLGRTLVARYTSLKEAKSNFNRERERWKKYSEGDYSDRRTNDGTSIYSKSNIPLEFITGVTEFMIARTCEDIFGSDPYFAVIPRGPADKVLAEQLPRHLGYKLEEARFKSAEKQAISRGYHLGEGLTKTTWSVDIDISERLAEVLCKGRNIPVTDENGDYVYPDDANLKLADLGLSLWAKTSIELMPDGAEFAEMPDLSPMKILVGPDGEPITSASGEFWFEDDAQLIPGEAAEEPLAIVLSKSPITSQEEGWEFEEMLIEERQVLHEKLDVAIIENGDFVCPLNIRHLSESKDTFHRLSLSRSALLKMGVDSKILDTLGGDDEHEKSDAKKPQTGESEPGHNPEEYDPIYECIEGYNHIDPLGDGVQKRVYSLTEVKSEKVLLCDYWANVTPQCVLPIAAKVPCPVPGRWYGRSYHKIYENETDFIDRTFNSIIFRNKIHANSPGFIRPEAFRESGVTKNFKISLAKIWELNRDFAGKPIEFIEIPDLDERTWQLLELVMQMAQIRSGVTGASQGALTNLPAGGTATGVQSIMLSGSTLHKLPIEAIKEGIEDSLNIAALILYANQNRDETFAFMEGEASELMTLTARSVKGLKLNVKLLLTRLHERESLESAKAAIQAVVEYITGIPESEKDQVRPLFIQVLKSLRITGADSIIRRAIQDVVPPDNQQERLTITMNYKDLPPDIQRQAERDAGYEPSTMAAPSEAKEGAAAEPPAAALPENAK